MAKRRSDSTMLVVIQTERYIGVNFTGGGGSCGHGWWGQVLITIHQTMGRVECWPPDAL